MWREFEIEVKNDTLSQGFPARGFVNLNEVIAIYENESDTGQPLTTLEFRGGFGCHVFEQFEKMIELMKNINPRGFHANS
jgi:hypothetical protein